MLRILILIPLLFSLGWCGDGDDLLYIAKLLVPFGLIVGVPVIFAVLVVMVMSVSMTVAVVMPVFVGMATDFHVAAAETASAFFAHINLSPPRRFPIRARAAARRWDCGSGDIR